MFRASDPQVPLFDAGGLLPKRKQELCEQSWAGPFRRLALPILRKVEPEFADLFSPDEGRPNRPVELVVGVLILKEFCELTDEETLAALEFDARWWWAFQREPEALHLCQKTLHNFRQRLLEKDKSKLAFRRVTDELIETLGLQVDRQRVDSTHILSNVAVRTRLGLMCETLRVFLRDLLRLDSTKFDALPEGARRRHGERSKYFDAKPAEGKRRLQVVARDVWRLWQRFETDEAVQALESWKLLERLFREHCVVVAEPRLPKKDDDDQQDGGAPVELRPGSEMSTSSMNTPHDPDVTYGHKGPGYEAQVVETCDTPVRLITNVDVTASAKSDQSQLVPLVEEVIRAGHKPREVIADTAYGGAPNTIALNKLGVDLTAPVPGPAYAKLPLQPEQPMPSGGCPEDPAAAREWCRRREAAPEFRERYAIRAGIESTNAELKHRHGLDSLRVRRLPRVRLAVYFKALACNLKRALRFYLGRTSPHVLPV